MRKESVKLLSEIVSCCHVTAVASLVEEKARKICNIEALDHVANKKFNLLDIVSKDNNLNHLGIDGVYHDKGFEVASNGYIIATEKCDYPEELEGKSVNPKTGDTKDKFPCYRKVIESFLSHVRDTYIFDFDAVKEAEKLRKTDKALGNYRKDKVYKCRLADSYFKLDSIVLLARFLKANGLDEVSLRPGINSSMVYAVAPDVSEFLATCILATPEEIQSGNIIDCTVRKTA